MRVHLGEPLAGRDLGLVGAHLVVREHQVGPAALHVERRAEQVEGDRRALDVPAGAAATERAVPRGLVRPLAAPHDAVERVLLALAVRVAAPLGEDPEHLLAGHPGLLAERRVGGDGEVQVVLDGVDRAGRLQPLDQLDDQRDGLDRPDVVRRRQHPQRRHVLPEQLGLALGQLDPVGTHLGGPLEQRVVDVGDVLHVQHLETRVAPGPVQQVEPDVRRRVADVGGVVRRDAADVHPRRTLGARRDEPAGRGVVQGHRRTADGQGGEVRSGPGTHGVSLDVPVGRPRAAPRPSAA